LSGDERLSERARQAIEASTNVALVSTASIWEIAIKRSLGKLRVPEDFLEVIEAQGFETVSVGPAHAWTLRQLPVGDHKDPFDRLLIAQALVEDVPVISGDVRFDAYGIERIW
jgi:PIN domain nuclease of toxin-antitoxin system